MDSRQRVIKTVNHREPDRVPTFFRRYSPRDSELSPSQMKYIEEIIDIGPYLNMKNPDGWSPVSVNGVEYDELGVGRRFTGLYWEMVEFPLAHLDDPEQLKDYPWPDLTHPSRVDHLKKEAAVIKGKGKAVAVMGSWGGSTGVFELSWYMRGLERFLIDCLVNRSFAEALMDKQLELHKLRWKMILDEIGDVLDIICLGDDLASQTSPLFSLEMYRSLIKPRQKELISYVKRQSKGKIYYHSCGAVEPFIPDLIEIGVDILDPIQPTAIKLDRIKDRYGKDLVFFGGIDVQHVLPFGTPREVKEEVFKRFDQLGHGGGLILGPSHWIQIDTPLENIYSMYEAIEECRY